MAFTFILTELVFFGLLKVMVWGLNSSVSVCSSDVPSENSTTSSFGRL